MGGQSVIDCLSCGGLLAYLLHISGRIAQLSLKEGGQAIGIIFPKNRNGVSLVGLALAAKCIYVYMHVGTNSGTLGVVASK